MLGYQLYSPPRLWNEGWSVLTCQGSLWSARVDAIALGAPRHYVEDITNPDFAKFLSEVSSFLTSLQIWVRCTVARVTAWFGGFPGPSFTDIQPFIARSSLPRLSGSLRHLRFWARNIWLQLLFLRGNKFYRMCHGEDLQGGAGLLSARRRCTGVRGGRTIRRPTR